jgi:hypothetical protein
METPYFADVIDERSCHRRTSDAEIDKRWSMPECRKRLSCDTWTNHRRNDGADSSLNGPVLRVGQSRRMHSWPSAASLYVEHDGISRSVNRSPSTRDLTAMRSSVLLALLALMPAARADVVHGYCERGGKRLDFSDGIAFADARDASGAVTTTIYLTAKPLDRKALAKCAECAASLPENTMMSPRGDLIEAQRAATAKGWMEIQHVGGELDITTLVNLMYLADNGTLTGLDGGNGHIVFDTRTEKRVAGKVTTETREPPMNQTDMRCDITFDLGVGWPK